MMAHLVALQVKIGLRKNGHADHPGFDQLPMFAGKPKGSWDNYIINYCGGWKYDHASGHAEEDAESPRGVQKALLFVEQGFATEAVAMFPTICQVVDEVEATRFYEVRHQSRTPRLKRNAEALSGIKAEIELQKELLSEANLEDRTKYQRRLDAALQDADEATDASNAATGVTTNRKTFAEFKAELDFDLGV